MVMLELSELRVLRTGVGRRGSRCLLIQSFIMNDLRGVIDWNIMHRPGSVSRVCFPVLFGEWKVCLAYCVRVLRNVCPTGVRGRRAGNNRGPYS